MNTLLNRPQTEQDHPTPLPTEPVVLTRRSIDTLLIAAGLVAAVVLVIAGGLLTWGNRFTADYVRDELSSQHISFPDEQALRDDGRTDLLDHAGETVDTGNEAEAYASLIDGHLADIADGATYADLGQPERDAQAAVDAAVEAGEPQATIDQLQTESDAIAEQRATLFEGETLRGLLLSAYAWSTVGMIAGIAAIAAIAGAALMLVLSAIGLVHHRRLPARRA
jgi:hypothetical protein